MLPWGIGSLKASSRKRAAWLKPVEADLRVWQKNPVTPDGMRYVPGEIGWVEARLSAAERPPQMCVNVCPAHKPGKSQ